MTYNQKTREGKTYIWGFIWGQSRDVAADEAQVRQRQRDLALIESTKSESEAA